MDLPFEWLPLLPPKLREGAELREPPKLLVDGAGLLYERCDEELPKLRFLLFGVNVLRGVVDGLLPNERCGLGRVTVERVLLCLPLPKDRVRLGVVPLPKDRVRLDVVPLPKDRVRLDVFPLPKDRVPLLFRTLVRVPLPKLRLLLLVELKRVPRPKSPRLNPSRIPICASRL